MPLFPNQDGEVPIDCFSVSLLKPDGYLMLRWLVGWRCEALPFLNPAFDPVTWHCIHTIRYESPGESQRRTQNQHSYVSSFIARRISSIMMFCWPSMLHAFNCHAGDSFNQAPQTSCRSFWRTERAKNGGTRDGSCNQTRSGKARLKAASLLFMPCQ